VEVQGEVAQKMCGASRPGHFRGVTTVCSKLFHICQPTLAFFGQKDAQQAIILEKMVRELNFPLQIVRMPIVREADGLAMSSRNVYLNPQQRQEALVLSQSLRAAEQLIKDGERDPEKVRAFIKDIIETKPGAQIDYIEINRASDLASLDRIEGTVLIALAVKFGTTRLIDNLMVEV
jgi:pantoate--beta-alanine ligase